MCILEGANWSIWLNIDLARQRLACVEYVLVHELAHLIERQHDKHLRALLDRVLR